MTSTTHSPSGWLQCLVRLPLLPFALLAEAMLLCLAVTLVAMERVGTSGALYICDLAKRLPGMDWYISLKRSKPNDKLCDAREKL